MEQRLIMAIVLTVVVWYLWMNYIAPKPPAAPPAIPSMPDTSILHPVPHTQSPTGSPLLIAAMTKVKPIVVPAPI